MLCMAGALGFPFCFSLRAGRPRPGQRDTHSSTASPLSLHGHESENMECGLLPLFGDTIFCEGFFFFKLQSRLQFQTSKTPSPEKKQILNYQVIFFLSPDIFSPP